MSADWWQNFANNFAADLAPLISLFGESPTKQYLSETLTFIDVFIFSMAPIGVITALVSAIRVAGSPTLRSFIGRAQEGAGIAEAELCSSTSRNVCEMYNNGGIARVFGRPKILEFVHDWERDTPSHPTAESAIDRLMTARSGGDEITARRFPHRRSHHQPPSVVSQMLAASTEALDGADIDSPPLERASQTLSRSSCNALPDQLDQNPHGGSGIYSFRDYLSLHRWEDKKEKKLPDKEKDAEPAYPCKDFAPHPNLSLNVGITKHHVAWFYLAAILGFALQAGVVAFAALVTYKYPRQFQRDDTQIVVPAFPFVFAGAALLCVGTGTCAFIIERSTYERTFKRKDDHSSRLYWVQPGDQVVGDQVFESFAYSDSKLQIKEYTTSKRAIEMDNDTKKFVRQQCILAWVATFTTTVGFVLQFLGLRTVHSTVSVAQLGAMLIMSMIRALLRTRYLNEEHNLLGDSSALYLRHELDWLAIELALESEKNHAQGWLSRDQPDVTPFWCITGPDKTPFLSFPQQRSMYDEFQNTAAKAYFKRVKLAQMTGAQTLASNLIIDDPWEDVMVSSRVWASKLACAIEGIMGVINRCCTVKDTLRGDRIPWNIRCYMGTASEDLHRDVSDSMIQLAISHDTERAGLHGPWKADRAELESILGLWLWSITSVQRIRQIGERTHSRSVNSVQRASRLIYVSTDSDSSDSEASLRLWLGNHSSPLQRAHLNLVDVTLVPGSVWIEDQGENVYKQVRENGFRGKQHPTARRIFGSNVTPTGILNRNYGRSLKALHLPSASSLEMMCTQEVFAIFFSTVAPEIEEIRGNTEIVEGPHRYYVASSTLSEMAESFISSGIGNHDDAIACMVPVLHTAGKLNYSSTFTAVRAAGEKHRKRKEWREAENVLLPALHAALQDFGSVQFTPRSGDTDRTGEIPVCLLSLCELYRWALLGDKKTLLFGLYGFISLFKIFRSRRPTGAGARTDDERDIPEDLLLYWIFALNLSKDKEDNEDILRARKELQEQVLERDGKIAENFHDALREANLQEIFYAHKPSIPSWCTGRSAFATAPLHGWYPVMKNLQRLGIDTRATDHNGLNYLHYAALRCNAPTLNDLIGDDGDLLWKKDNLGRTPLHLAAAAGRTDVVMLLIKNFSVKMNTRDHFLRSPLDNAIISDHVGVFAFLSKYEKEKNAELFPGDSRNLENHWLLQAASCCSTKIVLGLLVTIVNSNSTERLHEKWVQCMENLKTDDDDNSHDFIEVINLLEKNAWNAGEWQIEGRKAISFAAEANKPLMVTHLLQSYERDSIVESDKSGKNCLHYAVISGAESAVEALIEWEHARDLFVKDNDHLDPLEYALMNKSFAISSILLRKDPRSEQLILPGTAIAAGHSCIYFQDNDSQIRRFSFSANESKEPLCVTLPASARMYTPLVTVQIDNEDNIFYVSNENTIGHLRSVDRGEQFQKGCLKENWIKVNAKSSLAAFATEDTCYLYTQDEKNYIREDIAYRRGVYGFYRHPIRVAEALKGSDITIAQDDDLEKGNMDLLRHIYFRNSSFEIRKAYIKEVGDDTEHGVLTPSPIHSYGIGSLWCDSTGNIHVSKSHNAIHKSWIMSRDDKSVPTQFAVDPDPNSDALYYQSMLGDIRKAKIIQRSKSGSGVDDGQGQTLMEADTGEVVLSARK